ncbi:MAG: cell division protein ZapA [Acidobacteriota bacterium]
MAEPRIVHVEVHGQRYPIRTTLESRYVLELAAHVDRKMKLAAEASPSSDTVGLAVLTALNLADEYFRCRDQQRLRDGAVTERAARLETLVDEALAMTRAE